jgi:uncharacterized membrane protein
MQVHIVNQKPIRIVVCLLGFAIGFLAILLSLPGLIMDRALSKLTPMHSEINSQIHFPLVTEHARSVVRPSPDIIYSGCRFDLTQAAVRITLPPLDLDHYASISFFDDRTNHFHSVSNHDLGGDMGVINLVRKIDSSNHSPTGHHIEAPSDQGLVLFRRILTGKVTPERADTHRRGFDCSVSGNARENAQSMTVNDKPA